MADFTGNFQNFHTICPNMESMTQFSDQNLSQLAYHNQNLMPFSSDNFFSQQPIDHSPGNLMDNYPGVFHESYNIFQLQQNVLPAVSQTSFTTENEIQDSKKRKSMDVSESSNDLYASSVSESGIKRQNNSGRRKTVRSNKKEEKPKEVVHVRARRGQATDSHSLAERVRRSKINERLRCLQDIVPGCYKTMGMAGMLDEIINYVESLQNQVEFLSLKLTAASTFYDFNSEADAIEILQRAKANEAKELEKLIREDKMGGGGLVCSNLTLPYF